MQLVYAVSFNVMKSCPLVALMMHRCRFNARVILFQFRNFRHQGSKDERETFFTFPQVNENENTHCLEGLQLKGRRGT